jgi:putative DNA primase/helicase
MASNYTDVLAQLRAFGLIVDELRVGTPKPVRCKVEGDREKRGWYKLAEWVTPQGEALIIGAFGIWHGDNNNKQKIELPKSDVKREFTREDSAALRRQIAEANKQAEAQRAAEARRAAERAAATWAKCSPEGDSEYLVRKGVQGYGVRYSPSGALVIPMLDTAGGIHGLQVIRARKAAHEDHAPEKQYWPSGVVTRGHFHLIGMPQNILLIAEGYATGASLHAATSLPVAIAFDAGNLAPVAIALHKRYPRAKILICADDDAFAHCQHKECRARIVLAQHPTKCPGCAKDHGRINTGVTRASTAALEVGGAFIVPTFADPERRIAQFLEHGHKLTDFNDLQTWKNQDGSVGGTVAIGQQIKTLTTELGWDRFSAASTSSITGKGGKLRPIESLQELLDRFALIYGNSSTVFDRQEHQRISLGDMRDACMTRYIHRAWAEHPERAIVRADEVGFDPAGKDPKITCNLWGGWPTTPVAGCCDKLLDLLRYMCSAEKKGVELYEWVLCWLAYPLQHPGAKMKTAVIVHGPQGTGKNQFFEAIMQIYGPYGRIVDQAAIEDKFNDWATRRLFMIADEVVARAEIYHIKNKLKAFITGDWIRINPKNMAAYDERNHVNMVVLSNEGRPSLIEEDDRRHAVIYTPPPMPAEFYTQVRDEINAGGIAALHHYLVHLDLADFSEHTKPPHSEAKVELIEQSLDTPSLFFYALEDGDIHDVKAMPALTLHVYQAYRQWCARTGNKPRPMSEFVNTLRRKHHVVAIRERYADRLGAVKGPHGFLLLGGITRTECPPGKSRQSWLGECASGFLASISDASGRMEQAA